VTMRWLCMRVPCLCSPRSPSPSCLMTRVPRLVGWSRSLSLRLVCLVHLVSFIHLVCLVSSTFLSPPLVPCPLSLSRPRSRPLVPSRTVLSSCPSRSDLSYVSESARTSDIMSFSEKNSAQFTFSRHLGQTNCAIFSVGGDDSVTCGTGVAWCRHFAMLRWRGGHWESRHFARKPTQSGAI
jgi:hypothetical protein